MSRSASSLAVMVALVSFACGEEEGPAEQPDPRIEAFAVKPLPPVPGQILEVSVTGAGLIHGAIMQGDREVYRFVNGGTGIYGTFVADSDLPPKLTVRGIGGQVVTADATLLTAPPPAEGPPVSCGGITGTWRGDLAFQRAIGPATCAFPPPDPIEMAAVEIQANGANVLFRTHSGLSVRAAPRSRCVFELRLLSPRATIFFDVEGDRAQARYLTTIADDPACQVEYGGTLAR